MFAYSLSFESGVDRHERPDIAVAEGVALVGGDVFAVIRKEAPDFIDLYARRQEVAKPAVLRAGARCSDRFDDGCSLSATRHDLNSILSLA